MAGQQGAVPPRFDVASEFYWLVLDVLVVWRITHLLQAEDGPWKLVVRLRRWVGEGFWGELLDCFYCLSMWTALPVAVLSGHGWKHRLVLWPALSGAAILVERITAKNEAMPQVFYTEDSDDLEKEKQNVLRQRQGATSNHD
jgi:hypothetical protein